MPPQNIAPTLGGIWAPPPHYSLGPSNSLALTASRSVQPFCTARGYDQQTHRPRYLCSNSPRGPHVLPPSPPHYTHFLHYYPHPHFFANVSHTHFASVHQAAKLVAALLRVAGVTAGLAESTAGFMTHITCRLTAKNRDQLRNPTLGNRVGTFYVS